MALRRRLAAAPGAAAEAPATFVAFDVLAAGAPTCVSTPTGCAGLYPCSCSMTPPHLSRSSR
jgi:hypothetical protein